MKSEINLLPPNVLRDRTRQLYIDRWSRLYRTAIKGLFIVGLTYGAIWWVFEQTLPPTSDANISPEQDTSVEQRVRDVNELLQAVSERTKGKEPWIVHVPDVLRVSPTEITIQTVSLRSSTNAGEAAQRALTVTGTSTSRSAIVAYEQDLTALSWVERVESPLQNLASGPQVPFSFTIYRKPVEL